MLLTSRSRCLLDRWADGLFLFLDKGDLYMPLNALITILSNVSTGTTWLDNFDIMSLQGINVWSGKSSFRYLGIIFFPCLFISLLFILLIISALENSLKVVDNSRKSVFLDFCSLLIESKTLFIFSDYYSALD